MAWLGLAREQYPPTNPKGATMSTIQTRENRARRLAADQDWRVRKLRNGLGYWLIDNSTGGLILGEQIAAGVDIGYDLDAVEQYLSD